MNVGSPPVCGGCTFVSFFQMANQGVQENRLQVAIGVYFEILFKSIVPNFAELKNCAVIILHILFYYNCRILKPFVLCFISL